MSLAISPRRFRKFLSLSLLPATFGLLGCAAPPLHTMDAHFLNGQTAHIQIFGTDQGRSQVKLRCEGGSEAENVALCDRLTQELLHTP